MNLPLYLAMKGKTQRDFSRETGLTEATVSRICNGLQVPKLKTMKVIAEATGNMVTFADYAG